jgi:hypothetical protein
MAKVSQELWEPRGTAVFRGEDCIAICDTDNGTVAEYEARARLMSAAPSLRDVLVNLIAASDGHPASQAARRRARNVLDWLGNI